MEHITEEDPVFPDPEPTLHTHLDAHPACICTPLHCGAYLLTPGCPMHGMLSGRTFTWHSASTCRNR